MMGSRNITPDAIALIDARLQYPYAQECIASGNARLLFIEAVKSLIGVSETSEDTGPEVDLFLATFGLRKNHWCMAFQQTCIAYVEHTLDVESPIYASAGVLRVWNQTPPEHRVKTLPLAGAIACFEHIDGDGTGHTGMVLHCDGEVLHTVEGNQSERRDANLGGVGVLGGLDGVRLVTRSYDFDNIQEGTDDLQLRGCIKPFAFPPP
jgi:hypothetical protein